MVQNTLMLLKLIILNNISLFFVDISNKKAIIIKETK